MNQPDDGQNPSGLLPSAAAHFGIADAMTGWDPEAQNIRPLTALRGLAALAVLIFHGAVTLFADIDKTPMPFSRGYLAVDLFFLLSGFILMHVHGDDFAARVGWADYKSFLRARFARTYPVHIVILLLLLPLYGWNPRFSGFALLQGVLLTQAWLGQMSWNFGAWSISAEWHAYLLFPLLVGPWRRCSALGESAILLCCLAASSFAILASGNSGNITATPLPLLRCLPEFLAGMGLYRVYRRGWGLPFLASDRAMAAAVIATLGLASVKGTDIAVIAALAFLLLATAHNRGRAARRLSSGIPMYLGRISYSLYMIQIIAALPATWFTTSGAAQAASLTVLSFALAIPLSRYVEFPLRDWLRGRESNALKTRPRET